MYLEMSGVDDTTGAPSHPLDARAAPPIRLNGTSYAVLVLLDHLGVATPYDLKRALERSIANFWPVPHTTFYAEPDRLTQAGYLNMRREETGRRRKLYSLTEAGLTALKAWADAPEISATQIRDEATLKIFAGADPRAVFRQQRQWRAEKLAELEGYLAECEKAPETRHTRAIRMTLMIGIDYERVLLESIDKFLGIPDNESSAA